MSLVKPSLLKILPFFGGGGEDLSPESYEGRHLSSGQLRSAQPSSALLKIPQLSSVQLAALGSA